MNSYALPQPGRVIHMLFILALVVVGLCSEGSARRPEARTGRAIDRWIDGPETNGFHARLALSWSHGFTDLPLVDVAVVGASTNLTKPHPSTPNNWFEPAFTYYIAPNDLPGPFELKDAAGRLVPERIKAAGSAASFPMSVRLKDIWIQPEIRKANSRWKMPTALTHPETSLRPLLLKDLFSIRTEGTYELTLLPVIYRKSGTNGDILLRMDLPPVSLKFRYELPP
jgi:hypothetical protein